jgi:MerR family transcriptional regulator, mercuric resistance operon regulatory protein
MKSSHLSRGLLAKQTGVHIETIRYFEKIGLMPEPPRTTGGHRIYDESLLKRLSFIRRCRELGFRPVELRGLLELVDGGGYSCAEVLESVQAHLQRISGKIRDLRKMQKTLRELSHQCTGEDVPGCPIVEVLWQA